VSRVTIRRALGFLQRSGRVSRQRGQGTIVSPPKITRHVIPVCTIEEDLRTQGLRLETRVLAYEPKVDPPVHIRERLRLSAEEPAGFLSLTRLVQDRIICFDQRYFPPAIAVRFDPSLTQNWAVPDILQELAGVPITENAWEMQIIPAHADVAKALGVIPGILTLVNTFTEYLEGGDPVEAGMVSYRIDRVRFEFVASGQSLSLARSWKKADQRPDSPASPRGPTTGKR
jgi:GntR family transcriptional regulator